MTFGAIRSPATILFGPGQRHALGLLARAFGTRAGVCTDQRFAQSSEFAGIAGRLAEAGVDARVFDGVLPDVPVDCAEAAAAGLRAFRPQMVIGIGGGSCLDLAKAVAVLLVHGGRLPDYYGEFRVPGPVLPILALPTTAGTGSEVTPVAVLSDPDRELKVGIASPHLIPGLAICDPELTMTCPPGLTAVSGADALTHAIEAFTALPRPADPRLAVEHVFVGKNAIGDGHALRAIDLIGRSLARACADGSDAAARADMMLGATEAGRAFGTAGTAAAHALQYPIGALTGTPHGLGVALLMPYVMAFNLSACPAAMAEIGLRLGAAAGGDPPARAWQAVERVAALFAGIGIPRTLAEIGITAAQLPEIARLGMSAVRLVKNNPRPLDQAGMERILRAALDGDLALAAQIDGKG